MMMPIFMMLVAAVSASDCASTGTCTADALSKDDIDEHTAANLLQTQKADKFVNFFEACAEVGPAGIPSTGPPSGIVRFSLVAATPSFTLVKYNVTGLPPNTNHGLHVHQFADFSDGCTSTKDHWNPENNNHGAATDRFKHLGDLGNILSDDAGEAFGTNLQSDLPMWLNLGGPFVGTVTPISIVNRAIVVHANEDDLG